MAGLIIMAVLTPAFARTHKLFPATHDSIPAENRRADTLGLKRYEDTAQVQMDVDAHVLVPLTIPVAPKLPAWRRYALPETVAFAAKLDMEFSSLTGSHFVIDSAIRPADVQQRLTHRNRSAAPANGARASTHERGTTFDLSRRMRRSQYRWLLARLAYYKAIGEILVIEERSCIHVFVGNQRALEVLPVTGIESVVVLVLESDVSVQSGFATAMMRRPL
jgi:hypothetical protein